MSEHTPGPWRFDGDWRRIPTIFGPDGRQMIATIEKHKRMLTNPGPQDDLPEREANAHLIAAAPDLLAVLQRIRDSYSGYIPDFIEAVNAAIAICIVALKALKSAADRE